MKYLPITSTDKLLQQIQEKQFHHFILWLYPSVWEREEGLPTYVSIDNLEEAVEEFLDAAAENVCAELHGIQENGCDIPILIGGRDKDLNPNGEIISWETPMLTTPHG